VRVWFRERRWRSARRAAAATGSQTLQRRFVVLGGAIVLVFVVLSAQLFRLQVLNEGYYRLQAEGNRLRLETIKPARGLIYDRNGRLLAANVAAPYVVVVPAELPVGREGEVYAALQTLLHVPAFEIEQAVTAARRRNDLYTPIVVRREVDLETAKIVRERLADLPGVDVRYEAVRWYPTGPLTSHLIGYVGPIEPDELKVLRERGVQADERRRYSLDDTIGKAGVELTYERYLRGLPGRRQVEVDAAGRALRVLGEEPARNGANLVLTIDSDLQQIVSEILQESVRDLASKKAVAIVMDVRTGELLADVSLPTYDNNIFSGELDEAQYEALLRTPDKPLLDHAIAERFAPGSTFKIVTGLAALQEGVATPNTTITSNGSLLVPRDYDPTLFDSFPDWRAGLGKLNFYRGIAMSSDIYFYCLAGGHCPELPQGLNNDRLARYARDFGFGQLTGIDLPGETDGLVGDAEWLRKVTGGAQPWYLGDTYFMGIGQGYIEATPLQVVRMTAAVANGGLLLRPKVVREIRDADGAVIVPPKTEVVRRVGISEENLAVMREAMRQAVADGTAAQAQVPGVPVAGKTGTAEFGRRLGEGSIYGRYQEHGWFTGFAPFDNPEIAVVVFHEQGGGALTAAPTASRIIKAYFDLKQRRATGAAPGSGR
jgi:penicillin-binding protein 2